MRAHIHSGLLFLAASLAMDIAHAEPLHARTANAIDVVVDGWSKHLGSGDFNEHHEAVGVEWAIESRGRWRTLLAGGRFINSRNDKAWYASAGFMYPLVQRGPFELEAGTHIGLAQSDSYYYGDPFPFIAPALSAYLGRVGVNVMLLPPLKDNTAALSLQLKVGLWGRRGRDQ